MDVAGGILALAERAADEFRTIRGDLAAALLGKADDADVVHKTGAETIGGVKTFTSGALVPSPSASGSPVRNDDARLSDQRTPINGSVTNAKVAGGAAIEESKLALAADAAAGTPSRRSLGTGAAQAAAGNHSHTPASIGAAPALACMRRYRNGNQSITNNATLPIQLNATDTSVSRGSGLSVSGNGIVVADGGLCLVSFEVLFSGGQSSSRAVGIMINGAAARYPFDVPGSTVRGSGAATLSVPADGVVTLVYYVLGSPVVGGGSIADTGLTVTRLGP